MLQETAKTKCSYPIIGFVLVMYKLSSKDGLMVNERSVYPLRFCGE